MTDNNKNALEPEELRKTHAYWRACNYMSAGMIYLYDNPFLREPLQAKHLKQRLLGHWGSDPGQSLVWVHMNRLIKKYNLSSIFISGPGHGAPATLANCYLEGHYTEIYPDCSQDEHGLLKFFRQFSFPGGIGSHCTPETPGSIHEGGELGYSLSHAFGAAFDNPNLIVTCIVGDGEAETGPLATAWHSNKFLNPIVDGAVLPVLHLNGYKIANPSILSRIPKQELEYLLRGYGYNPYFVEGYEPEYMHQKLAATLEQAVLEIRAIQEKARSTKNPERPTWPMIVLRSPKGWTGPKEVDGHKVEDFWRAHQVPVSDPSTNKNHLKLVEDWLRSYKPEELFDSNGKLVQELLDLAPKGIARMSANLHANGGLLRKPLKMPNFQDFAVPVKQHAREYVSPTGTLATFLAEVMKQNMTNFRVFGPDETASNKLNGIYKTSNKTWLAEIKPEDADGTEISPSGRVMEMLSEHTLEGWFEGYVLTGRHGFFSTYESFVHVIDSMFNQHAKWLATSKKVLSWRAPISSINLLITSLVWRQDHNGFTHQDPGFLDVVCNKSPAVVRIYLPPDANCLLSVADHCLRSTDYYNVIVADKQPHISILPMDEAVLHCTKGVGIWQWASTDNGEIPDAVLACAGDVPTMEALAAISIIKEKLPSLKIRFVNVVDLFRLLPHDSHPHGLKDKDFDSIFTKNKPVVFNFHSYPALIHKLVYKRTNHGNFKVRGYSERGNINTPLELAIVNGIDRYSLVIDILDHVQTVFPNGPQVREWLKEKIIQSITYAHTEGIDPKEINEWQFK